MDRKPKIAFRGASDIASFGAMPEGFAPFRVCRNYRVYGSKSKKPRGSRRPTLRQLAQRLNDAPVQAVLAVSRASALVGYQVGECRPMGAAFSKPAFELYGQVAALDDVPSLDWFVNLDVVPAGGPANVDVNACCWDPDGGFLAVSANYAIGGDACFSLALLNPSTGAISGGTIPLWRVDYHLAGKNVYVNNIVVTKLYTFVLLANNNPGGPFILGYRNDTGALAIQGSIGSWCREAVAGCRTVDADGQENLFVAFHGSAVAGTYTGGIGSGTIQAGRWAMHFRSGIAKFHVESTAYGGGGTTMVQWGTPLASTGAYYEAAHGYWRFSEHTPYRPHGAEFTALAAGPDGSVYFTKRNQGWGPNNAHAAFKPDGLSEQYSTVGKISAGGVLLWLQDTDSIRETDDLGNTNDLTYPGDLTTDPSIQAICVDQTTGNWYAGGRQNGNGVDPGSSIFAGDGATGTPLWSANVQAHETPGFPASIREGAAALDGDGNPWFSGDRNTAWDGAAGRMAHLWKLSKTDGSILTTFDLAHPAIGGLSVATAGDGRVFYTVNKIT